MLYCFMKVAYFKSEFPLSIFVLAHLQKFLSRSIHFNTFLPLVLFFCCCCCCCCCCCQLYESTFPLRLLILTYKFQIWFYSVKNKLVRTKTILASQKSHDISFLPILCFAFAVSIDSSHYGLGENMRN